MDTEWTTIYREADGVTIATDINGDEIYRFYTTFAWFPVKVREDRDHRQQWKWLTKVCKFIYPEGRISYLGMPREIKPEDSGEFMKELISFQETKGIKHG